jgi:mono/diheme cytochrome c family protein
MGRIAGSIVMTALVLAGLGGARPAGPQAATPEPLAKGQAVFQRECKVCHGAKGDGEGSGAFLLHPRPRNLVGGVFRLRSTPNGEFPTDEDLLRTITEGIPGSMMPSFRELPEDERRGLVAVVKELAGIHQAPAPVIIPPEPPLTPERIAAGGRVYAALKCAECHGTQGRADGPSALTLKSDDGIRTRPADLTRAQFKGGSGGRDLYRRIVTGMDGSPMPSYAGQASPDELWALVQYVQSLSKTSSKEVKP